MKRLGTIGLLALLGLSSCDLSEAERMDLSRSGVGEITCTNPEVLFAGGKTVPLSALLVPASSGQWLGEQFQLVWKDMGTTKEWTGTIQVVSNSQPLLEFFFNARNSYSYNVPVSGNSRRFDEVDSISFTLSANPCSERETKLDLRVYDDRPFLSIRMRNDTTSIRSGDTLQIDLKNESPKDTLLVGSDYAGLRMLGDYLVTLPPGAKGTMKWIVVSSSGQSDWVDLSWGKYGQTRRIEFQTR